MTTAEGGIVTTHSEEEWRVIRSLRNQGRGDPAAGSSTSGSASTTGSSDVAAAMGIGQLERLDEILAARSQVAERYDELLGEIDGVELPCADDADHVRSWFVYVVLLPDNATRERVIATFEREGIGYNRYLPSIHLQPYMRERFGFAEGLCPVSEDVSSRSLALPFFTGLQADAQERVAEVLRARGLASEMIRGMSDGATRMVFLGFGKWARADRIYALEPITGDERGGGRRTRVWVDGIAEPILAGRTERTILADMGQDSALAAVVLDDALDLAERVAKAVDEGSFDVRDLGRRARRVLEKTARPASPSSSSERVARGLRATSSRGRCTRSRPS